MFEQHMIPVNDTVPHAESPLCLCRPKRRMVPGGVQYFHPAWDHREFWMAIEEMLGKRCHNHHRYIDDHKEHCRLEPLFEYDHEPIDQSNL